jgi:hypothetical protein
MTRTARPPRVEPLDLKRFKRVEVNALHLDEWHLESSVELLAPE